MTLGSLFSGVGGIYLGFQRAGFEIAWQAEIDPWCRRVLAKHWPDARRHDDVKTFPPTSAEEWKVDVIAGGFPCQDVSYAGKGEGIKEGTRSGLWSEFARIIGVVRPRYVLVENVAALLARGMGRVLGDLAAIGYDVEWDCLQAYSFGAPHRRERVFVIANTDSQGLEERKRKDAKRARPFCRAQLTASDWWESEPGVGRVVNGISHRVDRLRGLGNAVVPQIAEWLAKRIMETR